MFNNVTLSEDDEDVSYDVECLFTNIPVKETIDFICDEIYNHKKLKPICKQSIKLTTKCTFSVAGKLCKQIDDVAMSDTLSLKLSD